MNFAVVELKYVAKKTFVVPICWIKNYRANHPSTQEFYCYISTDLNDDPDFQCKYFLKFNGTPALFKVFVLVVTDSLIDAVSYQEKKRIKSVPQKFRQSGNTDAELNSESAKRKKKHNMVTKVAKENAKAINMAHLASAFIIETNSSASDPIKNSNLSHDQVTASTSTFENVPASTNTFENVAISTNTLENIQQIQVHKTGINTTENIPLESASTVSHGFSSIVREALETLDSYEPNFTDDILLLDNFLCSEPSYTNTNTIYIDGNKDNSQTLHVENISTASTIISNSTSSNKTSTIETSALTPSISTVSTVPNSGIQLNCDKVLNQGSAVTTDEFNYRDAYLQLKREYAELEERNLSLQNALVVADKALAKTKVPQVPFTKKDGGRLYSEGVFLNANQCKILDGTPDHTKYVNNLALAIFGRDTLKNSSVTGTASKKHGGPAKPPLNPLWLQLLYDLSDARTNKSLSKSDINVILNKKISNFNGADTRKWEKIARDARDKIVSESSGTRNEAAEIVCGVATIT